MIPDAVKEILKAVAVQVPGMVILGVLMYFLIAGAIRESTAQNKESTQIVGEAMGIHRWANGVLRMVDPNECCKPK